MTHHVEFVRPYLSPWLLRLSLAAAVLALALDGGAYALDSRLTLAIGLWWTIGLAVALRLAPLAAVPRVACATLALLLAFAMWTGLSLLWADGDESAFAELNRVSLYLAVAAAVVLATRRLSASAWSDGLAIGIVAIAFVALSSRLFPALYGESEVAQLLPGAGRTRLSYPVNYWNGLAILCALAVPLLLRAALDARRGLVAAAAVAPLPAIAAVVFLASSRGGALTALVGAVLFVGLTTRRYTALAVLIAGAAGSAVVVWTLTGFDELTDDPRAPEAVGQGYSAALVLAACCLGGAAVFGLARRVRSGPPRHEVGWALVGVVVVALAVLVVVAEPRERFETFRQPIEPGLTVEEHLLSGSSTGRWLQWNAALDQFRQHPLNGAGAGSYAAWWAQHGEGPGFVSEAHSLYLETLGELGGIGLVLVAGALGTALLTGWRRALRDRDERGAVVAVTASFTAYLLAAGIDWMWELTVVSIVGFVLLGLVVGPATGGLDAEAAQGAFRAPVARLAAAGLAGLLIVAALLPLLRDAQIRRSQDEAARGRTDAAIEAALRAHALESWASSPPLQLALIYEATGNLTAAGRWIDEAVARDPSDWRLRLTAARIATRAADPAEASRQLARARQLNPRSPLFVDLG